MWKRKQTNSDIEIKRVWARPKMNVTFRAEIMPNASRDERTFRIEKVQSNGRVTLQDFPGEYRETAFEAINFLREKNQKT